MLVVVHDDAAQDLKALKDTEPSDYTRLVVFLDQLRKDVYLQSHLLTHRFGESKEEAVGVKKWNDVQRTEKLPVWRLRAWDLEAKGLNYRLIYFYYWPEQTFYIAAVCHRSAIDYDDRKNAIRERVVKTITDEFPGI